MKNVVKKLFSLLLVGVVAISMFSFVAPPVEAAETAEAGSNGTLIIKNEAAYTAGFYVTFYSFSGGNLGEYDTGNLRGAWYKDSRNIKIPKNTYRVHVYMFVRSSGGKTKTIDFYANESAVNENSRIELTSTNVTWNPKFDVKINNGWSEKRPEYSHEGSIQFTSYFNADNPNMYFKATFYREDCQIGEKSVKLSNIGDYHIGTVVDSETIKIPNGTIDIKVEVIKEGTPINGDTLEYIPESDSKDDITITLGDNVGSYKTMQVNCPKCWHSGPAKKGTIRFNNNSVAAHPEMRFKATFYRGAFGYNRKIDEISRILSWPRQYIPYSETIEIPCYTTSVKVEIIKEGKPIDSATFELRRDKTFSEDAIKIDLGHGDEREGQWKSMEFDYPECWEKIK